MVFLEVPTQPREFIMRISKIARLFEKIQMKTFPAYKAIYGNDNSKAGDKDSAKIHAYMLLVLEIYIATYKEKIDLNKLPFVKLTGDSALRHSILTEYKYSIDQINSLSLSQMVFLLLKYLSPDNFCETVRDYLNIIKLNPNHSNIDWSLKVNWNLGDGADYLLDFDSE